MTIKGILAAGMLAVAIAGTGTAQAHQTPNAPAKGMAAPQGGGLTAVAELVDGTGARIGIVRLTEVSDGVRIVLEASNLPPGVHGFHVHDSGKCEGPDFTSAGGHFNPDGKQHGLQNPKGPHAGDLPNLVVDEQGRARADFVAPMLTLRPGKYSLLDGDATSLMIHQNADDYVTDPAGNAGKRLACGSISASGAASGAHPHQRHGH